MQYSSFALANEIAERIAAEAKANPCAFYNRAAAKNRAQNKMLAAAKSARIAAGGITEDD